MAQKWPVGKQKVKICYYSGNIPSTEMTSNKQAANNAICISFGTPADWRCASTGRISSQDKTRQDMAARETELGG